VVTSGHPAGNQGGQLSERIEGINIQLGVINVDTKLILHNQGKVYQVKGIDQAAGDQGLIGLYDSPWFVQDLVGNEYRQGLNEFIGHNGTPKNNLGADYTREAPTL